MDEGRIKLRLKVPATKPGMGNHQQNQNESRGSWRKSGNDMTAAVLSRVQPREFDLPWNKEGQVEKLDICYSCSQPAHWSADYQANPYQGQERSMSQPQYADLKVPQRGAGWRQGRAQFAGHPLSHTTEHLAWSEPEVEVHSGKKASNKGRGRLFN